MAEAEAVAKAARDLETTRKRADVCDQSEASKWETEIRYAELVAWEKATRDAEVASRKLRKKRVPR